MLCFMSSLVESITLVCSTWPKYLGGDANLNDLLYLAQGIQSVCKADISNTFIRKDQVVGLVELVETHILRNPAVQPTSTCIDPGFIRCKNSTQLTEEMNTLADAVERQSQIWNINLGSRSSLIAKSLLMWHGCINMDKLCRKKDSGGVVITTECRLQTYGLLLQESGSNIWIAKGLSSASCFRQDEDQRKEKVYSWIPSNSPYYMGI